MIYFLSILNSTIFVNVVIHFFLSPFETLLSKHFSTYHLLFPSFDHTVYFASVKHILLLKWCSLPNLTSFPISHSQAISFFLLCLNQRGLLRSFHRNRSFKGKAAQYAFKKCHHRLLFHLFFFFSNNFTCNKRCTCLYSYDDPSSNPTEVYSFVSL